MHALHAALVVLHVAAALAGFGAVALQGVYAGVARHPGRPGGAEDAARFFAARSVAEWALLAVPVLGVAAVGADDAGGLGQVWVAVALGLWLVAAGVVFGVARPARLALTSALVPAGARPAGGTGTGEPPPEVDRVAVVAAAGRLWRAAAVSDVVFAVALLDMVFRPR